MPSPADCLQNHNFQELFIELGWERTQSNVSFAVRDRKFTFKVIAHKRGFQILLLRVDPLTIINRQLLRRIQIEAAKCCHEHIAIYYCDQPRKQVWQWAIRLADGRKVRHREHPFFSDNPPLAFVQRLVGLGFTLAEEEGATLLHALARVRKALDTSADANFFVRRPAYAARSAALFQAIQDGKAGALEEFLLFHRPLARKISKRLCRWFDMLPEDAEQIAFFGLMRASRKYEPERGYQFSTYATMWIKQACQRHGPDFACLIRMPNNAFWACYRLHLTLERALAGLGPEDVQDFHSRLALQDSKVGLRLREFERIMNVRSLSYADQPEYHEAREIQEHCWNDEDEIRQNEIATQVELALSKIHTRQAQVLRLRYGMNGCPAQTLEEIGNLFSLTRERVRQIQKKAEEKLRKRLLDEFGEEFLGGPQSDTSESPQSGQSEISDPPVSVANEVEVAALKA